MIGDGEWPVTLVSGHTSFVIQEVDWREARARVGAWRVGGIMACAEGSDQGDGEDLGWAAVEEADEIRCLVQRMVDSRGEEAATLLPRWRTIVSAPSLPCLAAPTAHRPACTAAHTNAQALLHPAPCTRTCAHALCAWSALCC